VAVWSLVFRFSHALPAESGSDIQDEILAWTGTREDHHDTYHRLLCVNTQLAVNQVRLSQFIPATPERVSRSELALMSQHRKVDEGGGSEAH
jgi:hypothetical protein